MRRSLGDALKECLWRNHNEECANWSISELQMKKRSPKSESTQKIKQDKPFQKILTFG